MGSSSGSRDEWMEGVTQFSTSEGVEAGESVCDCEREKGGGDVGGDCSDTAAVLPPVFVELFGRCFVGGGSVGIRTN